MNGYALKKKGIRSKGSIIREMVMYGFSNPDIVELCPAKLQYVKSIVSNIRNEVLFKKHKPSHEARERMRTIKSNIFSTDEMDYGSKGQQKYTWEGLNPEERALINKDNHNAFKSFR